MLIILFFNKAGVLGVADKWCQTKGGVGVSNTYFKKIIVCFHTYFRVFLLVQKTQCPQLVSMEQGTQVSNPHRNLPLPWCNFTVTLFPLFTAEEANVSIDLSVIPGLLSDAGLCGARLSLPACVVLFGTGSVCDAYIYLQVAISLSVTF